jgi:hypothetical protein
MPRYIPVDHPPTPTFLSEEARGHLADRAAVVNAAVDRELGHGRG